ncbi:hypothetical protein [Sphingomonas sp.]|uniref:hypothetical protein n=1 Tax=Sphingomonas sp. TaxID=28214 RepID=UPI003B3AA3C6
MTNVKMKALDTLHISSVSPDNMLKDTEFEVSGAIADELERAGLASRVIDAPTPPAEPEPKADEPPANKMEPEPANKAEPAAKRRAKA